MNAASERKLSGNGLLNPDHFVYEVVTYDDSQIPAGATGMGWDLAAGIEDLIEQWKSRNLDNFDEDDIDQIDDVVVEALVKVLG